jgi:hypothetical protein
MNNPPSRALREEFGRDRIPCFSVVIASEAKQSILAELLPLARFARNDMGLWLAAPSAPTELLQP